MNLRSILSARAVQLLARYIASLMLVVGYSTQQAGIDATSVASFAVSVVLFGVDLLLHKRKTSANGNTTLLAAAIPLMLMVVTVGGCAGMRPDQEAYAYRASYVATLSTINAALRQGVIDKADARAIEPYRAEAASRLDEMEDAAGRADAQSPLSAYSLAKRGFLNAFEVLYRAQKRVERARTRPETLITPSESPTPPAAEVRPIPEVPPIPPQQ